MQCCNVSLNLHYSLTDFSHCAPDIQSCYWVFQILGLQKNKTSFHLKKKQIKKVTCLKLYILKSGTSWKQPKRDKITWNEVKTNGNKMEIAKTSITKTDGS